MTADRSGADPDGARRPPAWQYLLAFLTLYVVWGSTYLGIRIGLEHAAPPTLSAGLRLLPAGLILLAVARLRSERLWLDRRDAATVSAVGLLLLGGGMFFTFLAEQFITSGLSALIVALVPLWVAGAEAALGMERPGPAGVAGLVLGLGGLGLLLVPRLGNLAGSRSELAGIAIQVAGTWLWTAGSLVAKRRPVRVDALVATGWEMLVAGGFLTLLGLAHGDAPGMLDIGLGGLAALAYLTIFGSCLAFTAFVWLLRHAPASKVMTYAYVNPVVAVLLGWAAGWAGLLEAPEPLDGWLLAGMAVIVAGVALATGARVRPATRTSARGRSPEGSAAKPAGGRGSGIA